MWTPGVKGLVIEKGCKVQGSRFTGKKKEQKMQDTGGKKIWNAINGWKDQLL